MKTNEYPGYFWNCGLFDDIPRDKVVQELKNIQPRHAAYSGGEEICAFGEPADCLWIVKSGEISIQMEADGALHHLVTRTGPCLVGEQAIIAGGRRQATMKALKRVEAYAITRDALAAIADADVAIGIWRNLARIVSTKLSQATVSRAELTAANREAEGLLKRFVNKHGLGSARGDFQLRDDYLEEKVVVWFSDLVGFGELSQRLDPDAVAVVIRDLMQAQSDVIEGHGGLVDKFIGDGLMAYWVIDGRAEPAACSAALKAAHAAVAKVAEMKSSLPDHTIGLRIGLHVGKAFTGNFGSNNRWAFTLIGQDVNLAARLEQAKEGEGGEVLGPVRVSEALFAHLPPDLQATLPVEARIKAKETACTIHSADVPMEKGEAA